MLGFLKKIFGFPTEAEIHAAKAPYKIEAPIVNNKTGEIVSVINDQITDAVTQTVGTVKKPRKPRTPKTENIVKEKAAKPVKAAAKKVVTKRLKKV